MNIEDVLSRLEKVKRYNSGSWVACCPAHNDKSPSLALKMGDEGRTLLKCWAGCPVESIVAAIGLTMADLMGEAPHDYHANHKRANRIPASVVLKAMAFNALVVGLYAAQMAQGRVLTDEDKTKLLALSGAFQEAVDYITGG